MDTELDNIKFIFKKCMLPNCSGLNKEKMNIILGEEIFSGIHNHSKPQAKDFSFLLVRKMLSSLNTIYRSLAHH